MSTPDPLGRDRLATSAAMYKPPEYGIAKPDKPVYLRRRFVAVFLLAALALSYAVNRLTNSAEDSPAAAATEVVELLLAEDYAQLRSKLCRADREQVGTNDLESAGQSAGSVLRTLDGLTVTTVSDVRLIGQYAGLRAQQVTGRINAKIGSGTDFHVVTVNESGGWRVCLSPGGYGLDAFDLDVPIGGELQGPP